MITADIYAGPMDGIQYTIPPELFLEGQPPGFLQFQYKQDANTPEVILFYKITPQRVIAEGLYLIRYQYHNECPTPPSP